MITRDLWATHFGFNSGIPDAVISDNWRDFNRFEFPAKFQTDANAAFQKRSIPKLECFVIF